MPTPYRFKLMKTGDKNMWTISTPVGKFWVYRDTGRSWSGRIGSYAWTKYRARLEMPDGSLMPMAPFEAYVVEASTLASFRRKFEALVGQMEMAALVFGSPEEVQILKTSIMEWLQNGKK